MKIETLDFGIEIKVDLNKSSDAELNDIIYESIKSRLCIIRNQGISLERLDYINDQWGIHQPANIWASHKEFPKIIRVTNKEVEEGKAGLLHDQELDWHCNGVFAPDPEESVMLFCVEPSQGGETQFACGVHAYETLNKKTRESIENSKIFLTNRIAETFAKKSVYGMWLPHEQKDLDKMSSRNRKFAGGADGNPYDKDIDYMETKRSDLPQKRDKSIEKQLVVSHPVTGNQGLYFPFYSVSEFKDLANDVSQKEIFNELVDVYVGNKAKIHTHSWSKGDIVISDQIHSLHRREPYSGTRELYRTAFWYKEDIKNV